MSFISRLFGGGKGSTAFWQLAASLPDEAYEWFEQEECWHPFENQQLGEMLVGTQPDSFVGPFKLTVPKRGGTVLIWGEVDERCDEQLQVVRGRNEHQLGDDEDVEQRDAAADDGAQERSGLDRKAQCVVGEAEGEPAAAERDRPGQREIGPEFA